MLSIQLCICFSRYFWVTPDNEPGIHGFFIHSLLLVFSVEYFDINTNIHQFTRSRDLIKVNDI